MNRAEKKESIEQIKKIVTDNSSVLIVHYQGLNVAQFHVLRNQMRENGSQVKVIKNSLSRLAVADTSVNSALDLLSGPTALIASNDPVAMAKTLTKFVKDNQMLKVLGGVVDGQVIDHKGFNALSEMPSKDELRGKIIGLLNAPATKLVRVLNTPGEMLARVLSAYSSK